MFHASPDVLTKTSIIINMNRFIVGFIDKMSWSVQCFPTRFSLEIKMLTHTESKEHLARSKGLDKLTHFEPMNYGLLVYNMYLVDCSNDWANPQGYKPERYNISYHTQRVQTREKKQKWEAVAISSFFPQWLYIPSHYIHVFIASKMKQMVINYNHLIVMLVQPTDKNM